jgi:hypothetical protein
MLSRILLAFLFFLATCLASKAATADVIAATAAELTEAIFQANSGADPTIILRDGTYTLDAALWVEAAGVTVRSQSRHRAAVIIEGQGMTGDVTHIFNVAGANFTVCDVTLRRVSQHAIQMQGQLNADGLRVRNVIIQDTGEQMLKVAYDQAHPEVGSDGGVVEDCLFEYTAGIGPQWYIGGVDAHNARNWIIRRNTFRGIRSPADDVAQHAINFWSNSQNTLVEGNTIINCDRGIGFGLGDRGHVGGIIRNNMIYHDASEGFADVGIALESASDAQVYNNTIFFANSYPNAIEYRFPATTGALIANNLANRAIAARDGASGTVSHQVTEALASWFVNPEAGNLHLKSAVAVVVDQGRSIPGLTTDFDGEARPQGRGIDIGADEYKTATSTPVLLLLLGGASPG